jgi:four helix bundle protein
LSGTVKEFEDLRIFQEARELVRRVYALTRSGPIIRDRGLCDQMRRAAVSVVSNIGEGFERQSNVEFARYLYIAKGSCGELRAQALVALDETYWTKKDYDEIRGRCRKLSVGIARLIVYLERNAPTRRQRPAT